MVCELRPRRTAIRTHRVPATDVSAEYSASKKRPTDAPRMGPPWRKQAPTPGRGKAAILDGSHNEVRHARG